MNVLIVVPSLSRNYGGPSGKALNLADALRELSVSAQVVGCGEAAGATGLPVLAQFHANLVPRTIAPLTHSVRWADIVHVLGFREPLSALTEALAVLRKTPLVIEPVGTHRPRLRSFRIKGIFDRTAGSYFLSKAGAVVATSRGEMRDMITDGVDAQLIRLRPNGVSVQGLVPLPQGGVAKRSLGIPSDARLIVALGRIIGIKGLTQLPSAIAQLPNDVWAVIAGPDERDGTVARLRAEADRHGVTRRIVVRPEGIWAEEKRALLADASVFCLPSEAESFGVGAAEAAILGIPVVASDSCGVVEWLSSRASATFRYGDIQALVEALRAMLKPRVADEAKVAGPELEKRLRWESIAREQIEVYEEVLAAERQDS